jgi:hypothetical protein
MAETAFRGSTATSGAIDTNKKTGLKKTPVTFADFDAKMRSYGGSLPPGFDPRKFDIGGEGAIPGDTSMFPRMGKRIRGTGFPDKSELYESRESGPSPRFDPTSSGSVEEAARAAERSYAESTGEHDYGVFTGEGAIPSFEPEPYDSTPEGMSYRRDSYSGEMMLMPDERKGDGRMWSGASGKLLSDPSLLDPEAYSGSWDSSPGPIEGTSGMSGPPGYDPETGAFGMDPSAYSPGLIVPPGAASIIESRAEEAEAARLLESGFSGASTSSMRPPGYKTGGYESGMGGMLSTMAGEETGTTPDVDTKEWEAPDERDYRYIPSKIESLKSGMTLKDPLWEKGAPRADSREVITGSSGGDAFSRYYVPAASSIVKHRDFSGSLGIRSAREEGIDAESLDKKWGWTSAVSPGRGSISEAPEGMTSDDVADAFMSGVTGITKHGKKWYGDPEGYARGDPWTTPMMYDPETGEFGGDALLEKRHRDAMFRRLTPEGEIRPEYIDEGWSAAGPDHFTREKPKVVHGREDLLERGSFLTRGDEGFAHAAMLPGVGGLGPKYSPRYAFEPESGEYYYPSGSASSSDMHPEARSERLREFYGEETYDKLRSKDGSSWAADAELKRRAEAEGWSKGGHIEYGKFVPPGGRYDEDTGLVYDADGDIYVPGMEPLY